MSNNLTVERDACSQELMVCKTILEQKKEYYKDIWQKIETNRQELEKLIKDDSSLEVKVSEISAKIALYNEKILSLENSVKTLEANLESTFLLSFTRKKELQERIDMGKSALADKIRKLNILKEKKSELESMNNSERIKILNDEISSLRIISERLINEIADLERRHEELSNRLSTIDSMIEIERLSQEDDEEIDESYENVETPVVTLYFKYPGIDAEGCELPDGRFLVKKGSKIATTEKRTASAVTKRMRLNYDNLISDQGCLLEDIIFKSANEATNFCSFGTAGATVVWVNKEGVCLRELRRAATELVDAEGKENLESEDLELADSEKVDEKSEDFIEKNVETNEPVCEGGDEELVGHIQNTDYEETIMTDTQELESDISVEVSDTCVSEFIESTDVVSITDYFKGDREASPYYELYSLKPELYNQVSIKSLDFSVRLGGRLLGYGLKTVADLLMVSDNDLRSINGFGNGCIRELHSYLESLACSEPPIKQDEIISAIPAELAPYKEELLYGNFDVVKDMELTVASKSFISKLRESHEILDFELVEALVNGSPEVFQIMEMLRRFVVSVDEKKQFENLVNLIPNNRLSIDASWLIRCFDKGSTLQDDLLGLTNEGDSLFDFLKANYHEISKNNRSLSLFVKWCQFDIKGEIEEFFAEKLRDREFEVVTERAKGKTLDQVGTEMGVTRERIRQIEKKAVNKFSLWQKRNCTIQKLFIELNEKNGLSVMEVVNLLGENGQALSYLLKNSDTDEFAYDKQLDMFVYLNLSLNEKIQDYVESLPDTFAERNLEEYLRIAEEENEYPAKIVQAYIEESYKKTGDTYHRFRLSLTTMYADIMQKFYPNGLHVYDEIEIEKFREKIKDEYGIDISEKSDHAIGSILSRIGILCGRGRYKCVANKEYISKELAKKIHDYIEESSSPIFLTNTLFSIFEEELIEEGIDNKYFLQGILRELYESEWIFRRDYISKDESYTSVYSSIVGFIKNSKYPVSKEDIYREFPGVTEIVINISVSDPNILNLFGVYIHSSRLKLTDSDIRYFRSVVDRFLGEKDVCHCKEIYEYINVDNPVLLTNNFVQYAFSLYSLLEYLFRDYYNFSRPFVAKEDATIERAVDILKDIVKESERMDISEVVSFAREHRFQLYSIKDLIDSCNDTHMFISDLEVAAINYIGVTEEMALDIEDKILAEIEGTTAISQLQSLHTLPQINVEWNAWLIYSVLNKWSTKLDVGFSASQLRHAYPIVAKKGELDMNAVESDGVGHEGAMVVADDLSNIDELISDYILEGMDGLDGL